MKEKVHFQSLLSAIMLIVAGMISPSNGVDDRTHKTPLALITTILIIVAVVVVIYFMWILVNNFKEVSKRSHQQGNEES